jgi:gliding motility-associated-like protein
MEKNKLDKFDHFIKKNLENNVPEYQPEMWNDFQKKYNAQKINQSYSYTKSFVVVSSIVIIGLTSYFILKDKSNVENKAVVENTEKKNTEIKNLENNSTEINNVNDPKELPIEEVKSDNINAISKADNNSNKPNLSKNKIAVEEDKNEWETISVESLKSDLENKLDLKNEQAINKTDNKELDIISSKNIACKGEEVEFKTNALNNENIVWKVNNIIQKNTDNNLKYVFNKAGDYTISVFDKENDLSSFANIKVVNPANAKIIYKIDELSNNPSVNFKIESDKEINEYRWDFGDNQFSNLEFPQHAYLNNDNYLVKLKTVDADNCVNESSQNVIINIKNPLLAPTAFSPDGDGLNDYFIPKTLEVKDNWNFELFIYDNGGNLVYKTNDKEAPWNGRKNNSGEEYKNGNTFMWVAKVKDELGRTGNFMGQVTIIK